MFVTDSRKKSLSEASVNSFGGYPIGYGIGIVILPLSVGWIQKDPLTVNLGITYSHMYLFWPKVIFQC